jgi:hypothetical protein
MDITPEELREIILGKITFRKCPCCDNDGYEYWDENGISALPSPHPSWKDNYTKGACQNCHGIGYISNEMKIS